MRTLILGTVGCAFLGLALLAAVYAAQETDPGQLVTSPEDYVNRNVTITVTFGKVENVFQPWEEQANLKRESKIKFIVSPLREIACYAGKIPANEDVLGTLKPGQQLVLSGYIKECKVEGKVKGERETYKRTAKGLERYAFIVTKIESVGEAAGPAMPARPMRRGRRGM